jgi:hypothetical protein
VAIVILHKKIVARKPMRGCRSNLNPARSGVSLSLECRFTRSDQPAWKSDAPVWPLGIVDSLEIETITAAALHAQFCAAGEDRSLGPSKRMAHSGTNDRFPRASRIFTDWE